MQTSEASLVLRLAAFCAETFAGLAAPSLRAAASLAEAQRVQGRDGDEASARSG